jgi:putative N6-adenine-specific DNA methylase
MLTEVALERRLKRRFLRSSHVYFGVCSPGFEPELANEVLGLAPASIVRQSSGGVEFTGPISLVYEANLKLNTASRVLQRIKGFPAQTFTVLFSQLGRIPWEFWIRHGMSYSIHVSARHSKLNMKRRLIETCREAIDNRLRALGLSSKYDGGSTYEFFLRLSSDYATVSFNTSGVHLHKRGYKQFTVPAPIRETIAAGILMRLEHQAYDLVVDPFCGSGTFILEAARMSLNRPPGASREFAFMQAPFFSQGTANAVLREANKANEDRIAQKTKFAGFDVSRQAVDAAQANAASARLNNYVSFEHSDYRAVDYSSLAAQSSNKLLVTNPPYGKRLSVEGPAGAAVLEEILPQLSGWTVAMIRPEGNSDPFADVATKLGSVQYYVSRFSNGGIPSELHLLQL